MFFRSERLFLRPVWPDDWQEIYEGICDESVVRMLARAPWPYREEDARQFASRPPKPDETRFAITLPAVDGAPLVGMIGFGPLERSEHELGYWIARKHWGHGYATEAGQAVLDVARAMGIREVLAGHFTDNPGSGRVLEKIGFRPTGEFIRQFSAGRGGYAPSRRLAIDLEDGDVAVGDSFGQMPAAA